MTILFKDNTCSDDSRTWKDNLCVTAVSVFTSVPGVICASGPFSFPKDHFIPLKNVFSSLLHLPLPLLLVRVLKLGPSGPSVVFIVCVVVISPYKSPFISVGSKKEGEKPFTSMVNQEVKRKGSKK